MESDEVRVGVYTCHCGLNIAGVVDCPDVAAASADLPGVVVSKDYRYMCSDPGQAMIRNDIAEHNLNRVVVAACSPRMHEPTFRKCVETGGINPFLFEMANIREFDSWCHSGMPEEATEKAKDLVAMAVAKARYLAPLDPLKVPVTPSSLVIGGGVAGIHTALDLADITRTGPIPPFVSPLRKARLTALAPIANVLLKIKLVRVPMELVTGIDRKTVLPVFHSQTFRKWFDKNGR